MPTAPYVYVTCSISHIKIRKFPTKMHFSIKCSHLVHRGDMPSQILSSSPEVVDISRRTSTKFKSIKYLATRLPGMLSAVYTGASTDSGCLMDRMEMGFLLYQVTQFLLYRVPELSPPINKLDLDMAWHTPSKDTRFLFAESCDAKHLPKKQRWKWTVGKNSSIFRPSAFRAPL